MPAVPFHDLLANGQSHAGSGHVLAVQAGENSEYLIGILLVKTLTIVLHSKLPLPALLYSADVDVRRFFGAPVFHRVSDQILKE